MPDTSGHVATRRDESHTMSLKELEANIIQAGIVMSRRQIMRHCKAGTFDAQKLPATNNVEEWFIAPASVEKGIADIKNLQALRSRRGTTHRDIKGNPTSEMPLIIETDTSGRDATRRDVSGKENQADREEIPSDTPRHAATDLDIYQHPYVKRLEDRVERLETKYEAQVRRTEEVQLKSQEQLIELQRLTAVGQSQTLADFMLKARDWVFAGKGLEAGEREAISNH